VWHSTRLCCDAATLHPQSTHMKHSALVYLFKQLKCQLKQSNNIWQFCVFVFLPQPLVIKMGIIYISRDESSRQKQAMKLSIWVSFLLLCHRNKKLCCISEDVIAVATPQRVVQSITWISRQPAAWTETLRRLPSWISALTSTMTYLQTLYTHIGYRQACTLHQMIRIAQ